MATTRRRPSVVRVIAVTGVVAIAAVTAVVAVEGLSGARQPGSPPSPSSTPSDSTPPVGLDQLAAVQRADSIISTSLTAEESALVVNAHGAVVESCMQELGWDFEVGTATPETETGGPGSLSELEQWTFTDVASAESVGYGLRSHLAEVAAFIDRLELGSRDAHIPDPAAMSPDDAARFELDYFGPEDERIEITERDGSHSGQSAGGCLGEAERALFGDIEQAMWLRDARGTAESDIWTATLADEAVIHALDSWKACVRERGFEFEDPHAAFDSGARAAQAQDFDQERLIATTHAECVAESNLDLAVAAAFLAATNASLPEFEDDLLALQRLEEEALARAKDILGFEE
ncbi:MAG: hypothetical protein WEE67_09850 [Chloroflexota bacterium]